MLNNSMRRFENTIIRLLKEAKPTRNTEGTEQDLPQEEPEGQDTQNAPDVPPPPMSQGQDPNQPNPDPNQPDPNQPQGEQEITSPEEFELAKLAVRALFFDPTSVAINPKIFDDFENKKNIISILNYVENLIRNQESEEGFRVKEQLDNIKHVNKLKNMSIGKKLLYLNKNQKENQLDNGRRIFWTRIILNALRYSGNNYNLVEDDITPETINSIFNKLKQDFNTDTRGTFSTFKNSYSRTFRGPRN